MKRAYSVQELAKMRTTSSVSLGEALDDAISLRKDIRPHLRVPPLGLMTMRGTSCPIRLIPKTTFRPWPALATGTVGM